MKIVRANKEATQLS